MSWSQEDIDAVVDSLDRIACVLEEIAPEQRQVRILHKLKDSEAVKGLAQSMDRLMEDGFPYLADMTDREFKFRLSGDDES